MDKYLSKIDIGQNKEKIDTSKDELAEKIEDLLESGDLPKDLSKYSQWEDVLDRYSNDEAETQELTQTLEEMNQVLEKRKNPDLEVSIYSKNKNPEEITIIEASIKENHKALYEVLLSSVSDPQEFIGNGSVGEVYNIKSMVDFCIKKVHDFKMYNEINYQNKRVQNYIDEEAKYLEELEDFEVDGVTTPAPLFIVTNHEFTGLAMETIKGANFARVVEGKDEMPEKFDFDDFFARLKNYFVALHEKGILHKDMAYRNFMISEEGLPVVIDFGRSKKRKEYVGTDKSFEEEAKNEMMALREVKIKAQEKLSKIGLI